MIHTTEVAIIVEPIEFPLKEIYEKTNGTIEGLRNRDDPGIKDDIEDEHGDDDDDNDGDDGGKKKKQKSMRVDEAKPELLHYSEGIASDGIVYVNDIGDEVKLDSRGRPYRVGSDGRKLMPSKRPARYITPEEWKAMSMREREISARAADDVPREEVEEEDKAAKKKSKKKKDEKKEKKKSKKDKRKDVVDRDPGVRIWKICLKPRPDRKLRRDPLKTETKPLRRLTFPRMKCRLMVRDHPTNLIHIPKNG